MLVLGGERPYKGSIVSHHLRVSTTSLNAFSATAISPSTAIAATRVFDLLSHRASATWTPPVASAPKRAAPTATAIVPPVLIQAS